MNINWQEIRNIVDIYERNGIVTEYEGIYIHALDKKDNQYKENVLSMLGQVTNIDDIEILSVVVDGCYCTCIYNAGNVSYEQAVKLLTESAKENEKW